jgi:FtsH-binding integral membrane protein
MGIVCSPFVTMVTVLSSTAVPACIAITAAIFAGTSIVAYNTPSHKMAGVRRMLGGSLLGLIAL